MWTVLFFLNLWALHSTVASSPPSPGSVNFSSVNLRNIVQWLPGNGTPDHTHFTVQYAIYGDSIEGSRGRRVNWRPVRQCTEIVRSWCDLTNETWDLEQGYHARVRAVGRRASSKWTVTLRRFDPKSDTSFGPPMMSVAIEDSSAIISLKGPMRYQPNNNTQAITMASLYPQMSYSLSIHNTHLDQIRHISIASSSYTFQLKEYDTEYCFSANTRLLSMPVHCQPSAWQCITTPRDPVIGQLQRVVVGIVVPTLCMCMLFVIGYLLHHYLMGEGQKSPEILDLPSFQHHPLTFPPENPKLILITITKDALPSDIDSDASDLSSPRCRQPHVASPPPRYSAQRPETSSSVDYGFVGVAPETDDGGGEEEREWRRDRGEDRDSLTGKHQNCVANRSYERNEWNAENDHLAGVYASQTAPSFPQRSSYTCSQTHPPIHTQTESATLVLAHAWLQEDPASLTQSLLRASEGEVNRGPKTGLCRIPLNLKMKEGGMGDMIEGNVRERTDGKIDQGVEKESECEKVPVLSAYASQNINSGPLFHADRSDFLSDDYGALVAAAKEAAYEEHEFTCINWDAETRKLLLPEMEMAFNEEGALNGEIVREGGGEKEEEMSGELRLENVIVRQASETELEAQTGVEAGWEVDDIMTKWSLVLSVDP